MPAGRLADPIPCIQCYFGRFMRFIAPAIKIPGTVADFTDDDGMREHEWLDGDPQLIIDSAWLFEAALNQPMQELCICDGLDHTENHEGDLGPCHEPTSISDAERQ